jgi:hypothetical protein
MSGVVGIQWGYQNTLIAAAGRGGVDVILNGSSNRQNPYVKLYTCHDSYLYVVCLALNLFVISPVLLPEA